MIYSEVAGEGPEIVLLHEGICDSRMWDPLGADRLAREIPGARRATIANTAHVPSMERPEEFDEQVLAFLEGVG